MQQSVKRRRRTKQSVSLPDRLLALAREAERALLMQPGKQRKSLLRKAQTAKATANLIYC
jgi:hypothetical protein